jgi:hypothetical protein
MESDLFLWLIESDNILLVEDFGKFLPLQEMATKTAPKLLGFLIKSIQTNSSRCVKYLLHKYMKYYQDERKIYEEINNSIAVDGLMIIPPHEQFLLSLVSNFGNFFLTFG